MNVLRDTVGSTRFLIVMELSTGERNMSSIARKMGITPQAVSSHLKAMQREGLVRRWRRGYRATKSGIQFAHEHVQRLRRYAEEAYSSLEVIDSCEAIAASTVRRGDRVGLYMDGGLLYAGQGLESTSTGRALTDARKGQELAVGELRGIVRLAPSRLTVLALPGTDEGGSRAVDIERLRGVMDDHAPDLVAARGAVPTVVLRRARRRPDIRFAALEASLEAVKTGLSVLVLIESGEVEGFLDAVNEENAGLEDRIPVQLVPSSEIISRGWAPRPRK